MDSAQAKQLSDSLQGLSVSGWVVEAPIDHGKSAVVVRAVKAGQIAALKVFHPELIERFGKAAQLERIERERLLIGTSHPNVVTILDGGECTATGHLFVAMEYLPWPNLHKKLKSIETKHIRNIISQLAAAAMLLEEKGLAHRDIKPENIAISDDLQQIKLLDLGVIRPFGIGDLTDADQRPFIGTLRYSSPEFLRRQEDPTLEGWRAVTFYQIGAVLHDLLTKEPIFSEYSEPFTLLVEAVLNEMPKVWGEDGSLIPLCRHCLHKDPAIRLELVKWSDFTFQEQSLSNANDALERIKARQRYAKNPTAASPLSAAEVARIKKMRLQDFCNRLETRLSILLNSLGCFPSRSTTCHRSPDYSFHIELQFERSEELGLSTYLTICVRVESLGGGGNDPIYRMFIGAQISPTQGQDFDAAHYIQLSTGSADELLTTAALEEQLARSLELAYEAQDANSKDGLIATAILPLKAN